MGRGGSLRESEVKKREGVKERGKGKNRREGERDKDKQSYRECAGGERKKERTTERE